MTHPIEYGERIATLRAKVTDSDLVEDGRYFEETCDDITKCYHGDGGRYGELVALLWNGLRSGALVALPVGFTPPADKDELLRELVEALTSLLANGDVVAPMIVDPTDGIVAGAFFDTRTQARNALARAKEAGL